MSTARRPARRVILAAIARMTTGVDLWRDGFEIVGSDEDSDDQLLLVPGQWTPEQITAAFGVPAERITDNRDDDEGKHPVSTSTSSADSASTVRKNQWGMPLPTNYLVVSGMVFGLLDEANPDSTWMNLGCGPITETGPDWDQYGEIDSRGVDPHLQTLNDAVAAALRAAIVAADVYAGIDYSTERDS